MRKTILLVIFLLFVNLSVKKIHAQKRGKDSFSASIFEESTVFTGKKNKESRKDKTEKTSVFFSEEHTENTIEKDEDTELSIAPPGEDGTPQKVVTPLHAQDYLIFLGMSIGTILVYRKKEKNKIKIYIS